MLDYVLDRGPFRFVDGAVERWLAPDGSRAEW
jgi:hypothetical protein